MFVSEKNRHQETFNLFLICHVGPGHCDAFRPPLYTAFAHGAGWLEQEIRRLGFTKVWAMFQCVFDFYGYYGRFSRISLRTLGENFVISWGFQKTWTWDSLLVSLANPRLEARLGKSGIRFLSFAEKCDLSKTFPPGGSYGVSICLKAFDASKAFGLRPSPKQLQGRKCIKTSLPIEKCA